ALDLVDHVSGPRRGGDAVPGHRRAQVPKAGEPERCPSRRRGDEVASDRGGAIVKDLVDVRRARLEITHRRVMREHLTPALRIDVGPGLGGNRDPDTLPCCAEAKPWA